MNHKQKATSHEDEHVYVVRVAGDFESGEFVVSQLNNRYLHFIVNVRETISFIINDKLENTQSPWSFQLVGVGWGILNACVLEGDLVIWVEHCKLKLNILRLIRNPTPLFLLININKIFDVCLPIVIFRVYAVPFVADFIVSHVFDFNNSLFLQIPLHHLRTKHIIRRTLNCISLHRVSGGHHGCVSTHFD